MKHVTNLISVRQYFGLFTWAVNTEHCALILPIAVSCSPLSYTSLIFNYLSQDQTAMQFLSEIGPDALINTFAVNMKNQDGTLNRDMELFNQLQTAIFEELSGHVGMPTKRVPMFLTTSSFNAAKYGLALDLFKERLGVCSAIIYSTSVSEN